jgi:hypothetical protein
MRMKKLLWLEVGYIEISEGANYRGVLTTRGGNLASFLLALFNKLSEYDKLSNK